MLAVNEVPPINLSKEEIANPLLALNELFDYAHLVQLREGLWQILRTTVSGSFNSNTFSGRERSDMLCLFEHLQKLIEAAHLIHVRAQQKAQQPEVHARKPTKTK